jgi:phosphatidylinositol-3-phosphatase
MQFTRFLRKTAASAMLMALPTAPMSAQDWDDHGAHRIRHVFVIVLENEGFNVTFGPTSKAPYLSQTLVSQGVLLSQYYGTGHVSLDNYMAMISGQSGTLATHADCQTYADFVQTGITPDGQAIGTGCLYPVTIKTLPDQLKAVGKTWRGYMEDMGNDPTREAAKCGHPQLNALDLTQTQEKPSATVPQGDQYASRHNPFVYFHSIVDSSDCQQNVVNLDQLTQDLKSEDTTPNFVFITPNLCNDGHDAPCVDGQPGGLVSADAFLKMWVPIITNSPAYKEDGLLVINFDEGGFTTSVGPTGVTITFPGLFCCNEQPGPNAATFPQSQSGGGFTLVYGNYGGDRTGAVLLSPFLKPGTVSEIPYNHYSFLKTLEDIYETKDYLGYAAQPGLQGFFGCVNSDIKTKTEDQFGTCHQN